MKKSILLIMALFSIITISEAQKKYSFGFEVAPHLSWASSNTSLVQNKGTELGIKYGLRGASFFGDNYAISSGLMISHSTISLNYHESLDINTVDNDYSLDSGTLVNYHFQYLEVPLGLKFQSNEIGYVRVLFEGGFIPALNLRTRVSTDHNQEEIKKQELTDGTRLFALSYYFEGGIAYSLGAQMAIKASLFYCSGISDVTTNKSNSEASIAHNTAGLKIGVIF